jgi:hypothetical protein
MIMVLYLPTKKDVFHLMNLVLEYIVLDLRSSRDFPLEVASVKDLILP